MATEAIQLRNLDRGVLIGADHALGSSPDQEEPVFAPEPQPASRASAEFSLPPVDTGKEAWLFLTACWFVEAFTFGKLVNYPLQLPSHFSFIRSWN